MKTIVHALAILSAVVAATPTQAHMMRHPLPRHAHEFEAAAPHGLPNERGAPGFSLGVSEDASHQTATGGPSGGLF